MTTLLCALLIVGVGNLAFSFLILSHLYDLRKFKAEVKRTASKIMPSSFNMGKKIPTGVIQRTEEDEWKLEQKKKRPN